MKRYSKSCDVWSIGIMMYILAFLEPPFEGSSIVFELIFKKNTYFSDFDDLIYNIQNQVLIFPTNHGFTEEFLNIIRVLLEKNESKRIKINEMLEFEQIKL